MQWFKKSFLPVFVFAKIDVKRLFRDKVAIFFTFFFPLIFLFVFGGIFGRDTDVSFNVALINESQNQFAKEFVKESKKNDVLKIDKEVTTLKAAKEKMNQGELDATIILPENFGEVSKEKYPTGQAEILYDENNAQAGQTLGSIMESTFKAINAGIVPTITPFTVKVQSTATKGLTAFDFIFSGLLGFTILSLGIFGPTEVFPKLKQKGVLRRYHTTTLKVWQYFFGNVISNVIVGLLAVATMFIVALTIFDLNMRGDYASLALLIILGTAVLFGIGLAVGGWAKNPNQAAPLAQIITFPMMFLSGVFFPRFMMPEWLQGISGYLPLTPLVDGARLIITEGQTLIDIMPQIGLLLVWGVIVYAIAFKVFRWE